MRMADFELFLEALQRASPNLPAIVLQEISCLSDEMRTTVVNVMRDLRMDIETHRLTLCQYAKLRNKKLTFLWFTSTINERSIPTNPQGACSA